MKRELTFKFTRRQAGNWLPKGCRSFDEGFWTRKRGLDKQGLRPQPGCLARVTAVIVTLPYRDEQMCFFILSVLSEAFSQFLVPRLLPLLYISIFA